MAKKKTKIKFKVMFPLVVSLCLLGSFSVGFAMWTVTGGYDTDSTGFVSADDVGYKDNPIPVFSINSSPEFVSLTGYGFLDTTANEYINTVSLTWRFSFKAKDALELIDSMQSNQVWFSISLSIANTPSAISNFTTTGMTLSGTNAGTPTIWQQTSGGNKVNFINDGSMINEQWNITGIDNSKTNIVYTLTIPLTYTGTISNFPNLNTNKFTISLTAGEYKNA